MSTPQEIKSQTFEIKFRGYEVNEVNAYLQRLSEMFLTLTNQTSAQTNQILDLKEELTSLVLEKETLIGEVKKIQDNHKENKNKNKTIKLGEDTAAKAQNLVEVEKLRTKVAVLEEMNNTLRQEELDFKTTITAAQNFSNSLKEASEADARKLKEESETEAAKLKEESEARALELKEASEAEVAEQIEKLRNEMNDFEKQSTEERSQLLAEINTLKNQKEHVKGELKNTLHFYLNALDGDASKEAIEQVDSVQQNAL